MTKGMWAGVAIGVVAVVAVLAILVATATPRDPSADAVLYLERAHGAKFRAAAQARDSQMHEGFPDQYKVTCVRLDGAGNDAGKPFDVIVNYDKGVAVRDGGANWSGAYAAGEAAAFQAAAEQALDRPLSSLRLYPRIHFADRDEIAAWGPLAGDTERAFEVDLVVFGSAEQDGPAVARMLANWLPRWGSARKARIVVAFCGDRRDAVDEAFKGTGYGWRHNTDTLWTIELLGGAIGGATQASVTAAAVVRRPAHEVADEKQQSK